MKRRGSFKAMPGVKMNWTMRSGPTSVTVGSVNMRLRSGSSYRGRGPTRAGALATVWTMRPGIHYIRIHAIKTFPWDIEVNGNEITVDRVKRIVDANGHGDSATMTRAFEAFVRRWNIIDDDGKPIPITQRGIEKTGLKMVTAITAEIVHSLKLSKEDWGCAMTIRASGECVRVETSTAPFQPFNPSNVQAAQKPPPKLLLPSRGASPPLGRRQAVAKRPKSTVVAYLLWQFVGLVGGHRFYLGRTNSAFVMMVTVGGLGVWWLLDALTLPGMVQQINAQNARVTETEEDTRAPASRSAYAETAHRELSKPNRMSTLSLGDMLAMTPTEFEELTGRALEAMGYRELKVSGGAGDLAADLFGKDPQGRSVIVQCKRYALENWVGSPAVQQFIGMKSIHHKADRGIYVTTSEYSQQAVDLANQHGIVLIDGDDLVKITSLLLAKDASFSVPHTDSNKYCPKCGARSDTAAKFCTGCGAPLKHAKTIAQ